MPNNLEKVYVVVPVIKPGKAENNINSYRPIPLTSHVGKLMERIILNRLVHFCEKNNIIPVNQAGFKKGRCTIDHLIKISTQIKHQFSRRQSVLATFFDIQKAYDQVWHSRLLYKLKSIGLSGYVYNYMKWFLYNRIIETRVGNTYSSPRCVDMGIPQGSVIAPILFNILTMDLPTVISKNTSLVQYADDICIWMKTTLKKNTNKRSINFIKKQFQKDLDNINLFMTTNGLALSSEKTAMMLFNSGENPENLPKFKINDTVLEYKKSVKFLGVIFTCKLTWTLHIEHILTKARKGLNFIKIISKQPWGQNTDTLIHLATSLVRSRLTYAQEVFLVLQSTY